MKAIAFCGEELLLHSSGALYWPAQSIAVISDLHLEKGSYFARHGQFLPPFDSAETLDRLSTVLREITPTKLILLGDSFHDEAGYQRLSVNARALFDDIFGAVDVIWIVGNHDGVFVPHGLKCFDELAVGLLTFRHEAQNEGRHEISGHFHPKAQVRLKGMRISRPCFLVSDRRIILPAFGAFTGGLNIDAPEIYALFEDGYMAYLLGDNRVYGVPSDRVGC